VEAVIIAGGLGTRLRPLTDRRPKHLLPVGGVPFLAHQLSKLAQAGVEHVVLATSYRAEQFLPVFGDGSAYGLQVTYVREEHPLGTGGAIRYAAASLRSGPDAPVVVLNGDQLSGHDIAAQAAAFVAGGADVSLHLIRVDDARPFGCVPTDDSGRVTAFLEKSTRPVTSQINAGCYVFRRAVIDDIPAGRVVSVERETFPTMLAAGRRVVGHLAQHYWRDVGTPEALVAASCDLVLGVATSPAYRLPPAERLVQQGARVADSADVRGGSVVGPDAVVGPGSVVDASVLMPGVRLGADVAAVASVVGTGACVSAGSVLNGAAVGDGAAIGQRCELRGARVACDEVVPDDTRLAE
jgi:mannose-1-phosphate guanylyltransferase